MYAAAFAMMAPPGELLVWVGLFDAADPETPSLTVEGGAGTVSVAAALAPIRDHLQIEGVPRNFRCILRVTGLTPGSDYVVSVQTPTPVPKLRLRTLPATLPFAGLGRPDGLNILLCSCYYRDEDDAGLVGTVATQIKRRVDMVMLLGDQIYGDLPIRGDLPSDDAGVAEVLQRKYQKNFVQRQLGVPGLTTVLSRAPVICVADDHEYWNNFPFMQAQLPKTWTFAGRSQWRRIARNLYEDYQLDRGAGSTKRLDIWPLSILVADMRSDRDNGLDRLMSADAIKEFDQWVQDLRQRRAVGDASVGMLVSGQALMIEAASEGSTKFGDAELANYDQYRRVILPRLEQLARDGIPLLYVTGDVHWSRVARAQLAGTERTALHEIIVSPSCLISTPVQDRGKELFAAARGLFGVETPWPRHGSAPGLPRRLVQNGLLEPRPLVDQTPFALQGDRLALLSLSVAGERVDVQTTYFGVSRDKALAKSIATPVFSLRPW